VSLTDGPVRPIRAAPRHSLPPALLTPPPPPVLVFIQYRRVGRGGRLHHRHLRRRRCLQVSVTFALPSLRSRSLAPPAAFGVVDPSSTSTPHPTRVRSPAAPPPRAQSARPRPSPRTRNRLPPLLPRKEARSPRPSRLEGARSPPRRLRAQAERCRRRRAPQRPLPREFSYVRLGLRWPARSCRFAY